MIMERMKEIRKFDFEIEARSDEEHGRFIEGRAIVFNQAQDMGWYTEIIDSGALDDTDLKDVRLLVNHNVDALPLARSRNNNANSTMQLSVVPGEGMDIRANLDVENNPDAAALYSAVSRGDITGMSFMFIVESDAWEGIGTDNEIRHITAIRKVFEVSACTFPAYEQTSLEARGLAGAPDGAKASLESAKAEIRKTEAHKQKIRILMEVNK